jgi:hypothetical protein
VKPWSRIDSSNPDFAGFDWLFKINTEPLDHVRRERNPPLSTVGRG